MLQYLQVALDFMNLDHADFIALRKQLLGLLAAQSPDCEMDKQLDALLEHTRHHFAEEERQMQACRFPPHPMHKAEHDNVLADMAANIERWKTGHDTKALQQWLEQDLGDWFINHVSTMDFVTASSIASQQ